MTTQAFDLRALLVTGSLIAGLSACAHVGAGSVASRPSAILGGVDLSGPVRALGTEPFWAVTVTPEGILYEGVDRPEQRARNPGPRVTAGTATWTTTTNQRLTLLVTVSDINCSDGMSDRTYPLTARVQLGEETLIGCAASVDFLENTDEQG